MRLIQYIFKQLIRDIDGEIKHNTSSIFYQIFRMTYKRSYSFEEKIFFAIKLTISLNKNLFFSFYLNQAYQWHPDKVQKTP